MGGDGAPAGKAQKPVTPQGVAGVDARKVTHQIRGFRAGGSLAVANSTPATQLLSLAKMLELNHASHAATENPVTLFGGQLWAQNPESDNTEP
jgi:hypothetical protein